MQIIERFYIQLFYCR